MSPPPAATAFVPALIIVDFQNDFCPPTGSLAVPSGRSIAGPINTLLALPSFVAKVATKDWHPRNHISFASNHGAGAHPFTSTHVIHNPLNAAETQETRLWPVHCVQHSEGAELVAELEVARVTDIVEKGTDARVEMYSAFADPFTSPCVTKSNLADLLREKKVTHCYVVGLAYDYCVKFTAVDAQKEGFTTYVVREATKPVDESAVPATELELERAGVRVIGMDSDEVRCLSV